MSEAESKQPKERPAWLSDAKWVVGFVAFLVVAATAMVSGFAKLTEREPAVTLITTVTATMFSPQGLDDPGDIEKLKAGLAAKPGQTFEPLPGVKITAADVEGKSPRELRLMIFRQLAEPIYDQGTFSKSTDGTFRGVNPDSPRVEEPAKQKQEALTPTAENIGALVLLSRESHERILYFQKIMLGVSVGLLLLLILTSTGFGRLASPGWVFVLASALPAGLIFLVEMSLESHPPAVTSGEPTLQNMAAGVGTAIAPLLLAAFKSVYQPLALTGLGLIVVATLGGIGYRLSTRKKRPGLTHF